MKTSIFSIAIAAMIACGSVMAQQTAFVSDKLTVFIHSGPGTNYRIIGTLEAGERLRVQSRNAEKGFTEIVAPNGRAGWVKSEQLMSETSLQMRLPKLEEQVKTLEMQLQQREQELANARSQVESVQQQNDSTQTQLNELQQQNQSLAHELETHDESTQMQWFVHGGIVLAVGILFGILIPFLPRRKKHDQRWM